MDFWPLTAVAAAIGIRQRDWDWYGAVLLNDVLLCLLYVNHLISAMNVFDAT